MMTKAASGSAARRTPARRVPVTRGLGSPRGAGASASALYGGIHDVFASSSSNGTGGGASDNNHMHAFGGSSNSNNGAAAAAGFAAASTAGASDSVRHHHGHHGHHGHHHHGAGERHHGHERNLSNGSAGGNSNSNSAAGGANSKGKSNPSLYKTELCRSYGETGTCRYGSKCQFAHGQAELRQVPRHPKYKTEVCKTFHTVGTCPYGTRCRFIHLTKSQSVPLAIPAAPSEARATRVSGSPIGMLSNPFDPNGSPLDKNGDALRSSGLGFDPLASVTANLLEDRAPVVFGGAGPAQGLLSHATHPHHHHHGLRATSSPILTPIDSTGVTVPDPIPENAKIDLSDLSTSPKRRLAVFQTITENDGAPRWASIAAQHD